MHVRFFAVTLYSQKIKVSNRRAKTIQGLLKMGRGKDINIYLIYRSITSHKMFSKFVNYSIVAVRFRLLTQTLLANLSLFQFSTNPVTLHVSFVTSCDIS